MVARSHRSNDVARGKPRRFRRWLLGLLVTVLFGLLPGAPLVSAPDALAAIDEPAELPAPVAERVGQATLSIRELDGRPLAGAVVRALFVRDGVAWTAGKVVSDAQGRAVFPHLPIGAHWFLADAVGRARTSAPRFVGPEPVELELRLPPARALRIEVRDEAGNPLPNVALEIDGDGPLPHGARTGRDGAASPGGLGQGPLRIVARAPGWDDAQLATAADASHVRIGMRRLATLDVLVVDAAGKPASGAQVAVAGGSLGVARTTTADVEGKARIAGLASGSYDLRASLGMQVSPVEIGVSVGRGGQASVRLVLAPARSVSVRVVDDRAMPLADASLVALEGLVSPFPIEAKTDARGVATLGPIARGPAALHASAPGFVPRGPIDLASAEASPTAPIEIVLRRAGTLIVDVRDARGGAVDGASVEVIGTDLDGQPIDATPASLAFADALRARPSAGRTLVPMGELGVVPGPVAPIPHLRSGFTSRAAGGSSEPTPWVTAGDGVARAAPVPPGRVRAIVRHPAYVEAISAAVDLAAGGEARVSVVMNPGGRLSGRVVDDRGHAVVGALLEVSARRGTMVRATRTGDGGSYALVALPGEVSIAVSLPDRAFEVVLRVDANIPEGGATELELALPPPREATKVTVLDDRRYPIRGAQITVSSVDPTVPFKSTAFSDEHGEATIARAAGIAAQIDVRATGRAAHRASYPSFPASLEIELRAGIAVRGVVYTPYGRGPQSGATVTLVGDGGSRRAITDDAGRFVFADVSPGEASLDVRASGTAGARRAVTVAETGSRAEVDVGRIELDPAGIVEGTVVDERGNAVIGARVARDHAPTYVPASGPGPGVAITDGLGTFRLVDVAIGEVELEGYAADIGRGRSGKTRVDEGRVRSGVVIVLHPVAASVGGDDLTPGGVAVTLGEADGRVTIVSVSPGSEAERAGLRSGDDLETIDAVMPSSMADARARLGGPLGADVILIVRRGSTRQTIRVPRESIKR